MQRTGLERPQGEMAGDDDPTNGYNAAPTMTDKAPYALRGDRPIESAEEDRLGRASFARAIAAQILEAPPLDSYVVAVMGPWGCGKTSLINIVAEEVKLRSNDVVVLKFNPWMFSGTEQLVSQFFRELGAQCSDLKTDRLATVGTALRRYGGLFGSVVRFVPVAGSVLKEVADVAKGTGEALAEGPSIMNQRDAIREQLKKIDTRIIVLVDDIDRLRRDEIREVMKLVRLTGDFPNIVYVLAFDRDRVERALGEDDETGRAYLEKIVQAAYDVPVPMGADIGKLLLDELQAATEGIDYGPFDQMDWNNIYQGVVRPLVRSPRDVRRYVNSLPPTLRILGREVALCDVLALEAVRVFLPDVFTTLPAMVEPLTTSAEERYLESSGHREAVQAFVSSAGKHREVIHALIRRLFPSGERFVGGVTYGWGYSKKWRRDRRVAASEVLRFYLEHRLPEGVVQTAQVQEAFVLLGDRRSLVEKLDTLAPEHLESLLGRLEAYEDEFPVNAIEPAVGALLDQLGRLREKKRHIFDPGADMALGRVVLRLLRRQESEAEREAIVTRTLPTLRWLSGQLELIRLMGGHELAPATRIAEWKTDLVAKVVAAITAGSLGGERHLGSLLQLAIETGGLTAEAATLVIEDDRLLARLVGSVMTESSRLSLGDVASVETLKLPWDRLIELFGAEHLPTGVKRARANLRPDDLEHRDNLALDLAARYASGWRPKDDPLDEDDDEETGSTPPSSPPAAPPA